MINAPSDRLARYRRYDEALDLAGVDLFSLLDRPRAEIEPVIPGLVPSAAMESKRFAISELTLMTDEAADELHEWPNARLGPTFRHLRVYFLNGRLLGLNWKFPPKTPASEVATANHPWYRRWFGLDRR